MPHYQCELLKREEDAATYTLYNLSSDFNEREVRGAEKYTRTTVGIQNYLFLLLSFVFMLLLSHLFSLPLQCG